MGLRITPLLGWGVVIYSVMFLLASALATYGAAEGVIPSVLSIMALVAVCVAAGSSLQARSWLDVIPYSASWAFVSALLDGVMAFPFSGWQAYADWSVWLGYALVAAVPLIAPLLRRGAIGAHSAL